MEIPEGDEILPGEMGEGAHPFAFHVSGPRNLASPNWRDVINSSWKDEKYKRTVMACFIQAVYLLELDRQEKRTKETALAPNWWLPFKYKLVKTLIDERDQSIFGAVLEWDQIAARANMIPFRLSGAPKAIIVLRGTLLKTPTMRRDLEDDLRFFAWESLRGSVRFTGALEAVRAAAESYGSCHVCIAGHSLGAGFALQVGKALAKEGLSVETHLFNPPSVSIAMSLKEIGEKAESAWKRIRAMLPLAGESETVGVGVTQSTGPPGAVGLKKWVPYFKSSGSAESQKWIPNLYVNDGDYICCSYTNPDGPKETGDRESDVAAKLFVTSKGKQRFLEAHGLEQWWSDDVQLQLAMQNSRVISRQLKSLYHQPSLLQKL